MTRGSKVNIEKYISEIAPYLTYGCSLHEACCSADVPYRTVLDYYSNNEQVRQKIDSLQTNVITAARKTLLEGIQSDARLALDFLKHKIPNEFSTKQTIDNKHSHNISDILSGIDDPDLEKKNHT